VQKVSIQCKVASSQRSACAEALMHIWFLVEAPHIDLMYRVCIRLFESTCPEEEMTCCRYICDSAIRGCHTSQRGHCCTAASVGSMGAA